MTEEFIFKTLANWFETPCNYSFNGYDAMDIVSAYDSTWCERHCGDCEDWECWRKLFEAMEFEEVH